MSILARSVLHRSIVILSTNPYITLNHSLYHNLYLHIYYLYYNNTVKANENENDEDDYLVDHSIVLYLVNPDGEFVDFFTQRMEDKEIVEKIEKYVKEYHIEKAAAAAEK